MVDSLTQQKYGLVSDAHVYMGLATDHLCRYFVRKEEEGVFDKTDFALLNKSRRAMHHLFKISSELVFLDPIFSLDFRPIRSLRILFGRNAARKVLDRIPLDELQKFHDHTKSAYDASRKMDSPNKDLALASSGLNDLKENYDLSHRKAVA
tara:strand:+ start:439 stop:891 length:453 start_codon:yes stop_codon:yes gene_type:complete